jgi:sugar O-acyltransferase (sialic acid O-acetyltransferase NeuD family)
MSGTCAVSSQFEPRFRKLYIFGAGGHGREIAWLAQQAWGADLELEFLVDRTEFLSEPVNDIPVRLLGESKANVDTRFVVALGDPILRRVATAACVSAGHAPAQLVHPRAEMSARVALGEGVVIFAGAIITTNVRIAAHVHVNVACTISHDVTIGEFATLSPGVHVAGHVVIGRNVFIGIGASVINGRRGAPLVVGDDAIIAAGACVTRSVEPGAMVAGIPAHRKR